MNEVEPLLVVRDLRVRFRGHGARSHQAVDGVSIEVRRGETLGLVGESGCGKSTTARAILRLIDRHRHRAEITGSVRYRGVNMASARGRELRRMRGRLQMIFQDPLGSLNPRMSVGSIIAEPLEIQGVPRRDRHRRVRELLELVGLSEEAAGRYPHEFSGGQRQRIGIARALAPGPELIVCDEPVSALDVSVQAQILNLLKDVQESLKVAYLFIAHDLEVVRHLCQEVAVMREGRIVEHAATELVFREPSHPYTRELLASSPRLPS